MNDRISTALHIAEVQEDRAAAPQRPTTAGRPVSALIDTLIARNPLLGHGPRTHANGIAVASDPRPSATKQARRRPLDVDAPKIHLGHAGRAA